MSDNLFPAGLIVDLPRLNIEMMQFYAKMWNVEHKQIGKGVFRGSLFGIHTPRIQLGISHFSRAIMTKGSFPERCIVIYSCANRSENDPVFNFHNRTVAENEVVVLTKDDTLDLLTHDAVDLHTLVIEEKLFYKAFDAFFGEIPDEETAERLFYLKEDKIAHIHQIQKAYLSYLADVYPKLEDKPKYEEIEAEMLEELFSCMYTAPAEKKRKKFQIKEVRDLLHANIDKSVDIGTIFDEFKLGESQLYELFKKEYGVTPKRYLRLLRFNAIKKELLQTDPDSTTIAKIAKKYHISQMGHFSTAYKELFSETPSQTFHKEQKDP
jgi:AraC-like DNA-binding protein